MSWFKPSRRSSSRRGKPLRKRITRLEQFEHRLLMDAAFASELHALQGGSVVAAQMAPVHLDGDGTIVIKAATTGSDVDVHWGPKGESIVVNMDGKEYSFNYNQAVFTGTDNHGGSFDYGYAAIQSVRGIQFIGSDRADTFLNRTQLFATVQGNAGDDQLSSGARCVIDGGTGNDRIKGSSDNDELHGGAGNDVIDGDAGSDQIFGDAGNDKLDGGDGDDSLFGGAGNDLLIGGYGNDRLYGEAGHDDLYGDAFAITAAEIAAAKQLPAGVDYLDGGTGVDYFSTIGERLVIPGVVVAGNKPVQLNTVFVDPVVSGERATDGFVAYDGRTRFVKIDDTQSSTNLVPGAFNGAETAFLDMNAAWQLQREGILTRLHSTLENTSLSGRRIYDVEISMPESGETLISQDADGVHLRLVLSGARLAATLTQDSILGKWADPRVSMQFDVVIDLTLAKTGGLTVTRSVAAVANARGLSAEGPVASMVMALDLFFGGGTTQQRAMDAINGKSFANLVPRNVLDAVNQYAPGASVSYDDASGAVMIRLPRSAAPTVQQDLNWKLTEVSPVLGVTPPASQMSQAVQKLANTSTQMTSPSTKVDVTAPLAAKSSVVSKTAQVTLNPQPLPPKESKVVASLGEKVTLNPQPLPPKESRVIASLGEKATLNPQPLPPKESKIVASLGEKVTLNPQPLPPKESKVIASLGEKVTLNPQPLPPKQLAVATKVSDKVSLNPQPLPPKALDHVFANDLDRVLLNPQPLPPRDLTASVTPKTVAASTKSSNLWLG